MWELDCEESWVLKNWCFWTMVLEKALESKTLSWTARRSNQSILNETSPGCSLEGLMLRLKLQYFGHLMRRVGKDPDAGRDWGQEEGEDRGWDGWMASPTRYTWVWVNSGSWWWTGKPGMLRYMGSQSRTRLSDWTEHLAKMHCVVYWGFLACFLTSFIYLWLCWVFITALGLSRVVASGKLLCSCSAQASHCSDFSCCRTCPLGHVGFSSCSARA